MFGLIYIFPFLLCWVGMLFEIFFFPYDPYDVMSFFFNSSMVHVSLIFRQAHVRLVTFLLPLSMLKKGIMF